MGCGIVQGFGDARCEEAGAGDFAKEGAHVTSCLAQMLLSAPEAGKGKMAAMERLLASNTGVEPTEEEVALEQAALQTVHKEMTEADEANLLDEEDMHVFDREPLSDHLPLVSCNSCKKPVKASQYASHAERCRSLNASEETALDFERGLVSKKAPRKQRKKISAVQDNNFKFSDGDKLHTPEGEDGVFSESACASGGAGDDQAPAVTSSSNPRGSKRVMNISEGTVVNAPKVGRPRKNPIQTAKAGNSLGSEDTLGTLSSPANTELLKSNMIHSSLSPEELDIMCGVMSINGSCCRQPLTCKTHPDTSKRAVFGRRKPFDVLVQELKEGSVSRLRSELKRKRLHETEPNASFRRSLAELVCPQPLASKVYSLGHNDRMKYVLGHLFRRNCANVTPVTTDTVPAVIGAQAAPPPTSSLENSLVANVTTSSAVYNMSGNVQDVRRMALHQGTMNKASQAWPQLDQQQVHGELLSSITGVAHSPHHQDRYLQPSRPLENGLSNIGKGWQSRGSQMQTVMPGVTGQQLSHGGVSVV